jgi:hypothetical protein
MAVMHNLLIVANAIIISGERDRSFTLGRAVA